jgi:hypothetical protein
MFNIQRARVAPTRDPPVLAAFDLVLQKNVVS